MIVLDAVLSSQLFREFVAGLLYSYFPLYLNLLRFTYLLVFAFDIALCAPG